MMNLLVDLLASPLDRVPRLQRSDTMITMQSE